VVRPVLQEQAVQEVPVLLHLEVLLQQQAPEAPEETVEQHMPEELLLITPPQVLF
jgi:hypothetical protein